MQAFQQRVVDEKADLDDKRAKLLAFFNTDVFRGLDQAEKDRLRTQHGLMGSYSEILHQRIAAFAKEGSSNVRLPLPDRDGNRRRVRERATEKERFLRGRPLARLLVLRAAC